MAHIEHLTSIHTTAADAWAIDGVLSGLSLIWGEPGSCKSFVAISMAVSIASGCPWLGKKTISGRVVYIAGEGGSYAVARRMRAALRKWTIDPMHDNVPIDIVTPGVNLVKGPGEMVELIGEDHPKLIVVDTLSRCFVGDENKQEFMGGFVRSLDILRDCYPNSCQLVIHHSNKEDQIRGSTVLLGAVDTSWKLEKIKGSDEGIYRIMKPDKIRERDVEGAYLRMLMEKVPCYSSEGNPEYDSYGDWLTTLIVKPHPEDKASAQSVRFFGEKRINQAGHIDYLEWREGCKMDKAKFDAALSYILTYPGDWGGIVQESPGKFVIDHQKGLDTETVLG